MKIGDMDILLIVLIICNISRITDESVPTWDYSHRIKRHSCAADFPSHCGQTYTKHLSLISIDITEIERVLLNSFKDR